MGQWRKCIGEMCSTRNSTESVRAFVLHCEEGVSTVYSVKFVTCVGLWVRDADSFLSVWVGLL
jgi:hypothetical protein